MPKYDIPIVIRVTETVQVVAVNEQDAKEKVQQRLADGTLPAAERYQRREQLLAIGEPLPAAGDVPVMDDAEAL